MSREITDAEIEFISLVKRAANKRKFLIVKQTERKNNMTKELRKGTSVKEAKEILTNRLVETICNFLEEAENAGVAVDLNGLEVSAKSVEKSSGEHYLHGLL